MNTNGSIENTKRILVIDDEELLTKSYGLLLRKNGYDVMIVKSGADALVMTEEERFDLIICDIRMPGMNGVETVQAIRSQRARGGKGADVPVIFVTGYVDEAIESEAQKTSPLGYLFKPFENADLLELVKRGLSK